jgi:hypothetical protein
MENKSVTIRISVKAWELLSRKVIGKFGYGQLITEAVMEKYGKGQTQNELQAAKA